MAMAILGFCRTTSTISTRPPTGGVVGNCGSGYSFRTQHEVLEKATLREKLVIQSAFVNIKCVKVDICPDTPPTRP